MLKGKVIPGPGHSAEQPVHENPRFDLHTGSALIPSLFRSIENIRRDRSASETHESRSSVPQVRVKAVPPVLAVRCLRMKQSLFSATSPGFSVLRTRSTVSATFCCDTGNALPTVLLGLCIMKKPRIRTFHDGM